MRFMRLSLRSNNSSRDNTDFLKKIERKLSESRILPASYEAETLVRHFGRMRRLDLFAGEKRLARSVKSRIHQALRTRLTGRPLAYLLKETEFFGHRFFVTKDTLIPRPETELLVEEALKAMRSLESLRSLGTTAKQPRVRPLEILDVGTGCGCLAVALTLERPGCRMTALELSSRALKIARKNIKYHHLGHAIELVQSDLFRVFGKEKKAFWDVIISNPPYVAGEDYPQLPEEVLAEPRLALDGGRRGLRIIGRILEESPYYLKRGGWLLLEMGEGQSAALKKRIEREKVFKNLRLVKDYNGVDRILVMQKQ